MHNGEYSNHRRQTKDQPRREGQAIMTTDGMKRRDFLRTVTTLVGAVALGGSASLLSGCGGNGGASGNNTPPPTPIPTAPAGVSANSAASALTNAGVSGVSNSSAGASLHTVSGSTSSTAASDAATAMSSAVSSLPESAPLGFIVNGQVQTISASTFQAGIGTLLAQIAALPAGQGPTIQAGDTVKIITYTLSSGQQVSSPAIVDANGNVVFDLASFGIIPAPSDTTHTVTQSKQQGTGASASTTLFNPVTGMIIFSDRATGYANSEANGNLNATTPVTNINTGTPTLGPGASISGSPTIGTPQFKSVAAVKVVTRQSAGGSTCVVLVILFLLVLALFGIQLSQAQVQVLLNACSNTGNGGQG